MNTKEILEESRTHSVKSKKINLSFEQELNERFTIYCKNEKITKSRLANILVRKFLNEVEPVK